MTRLLLTLGLVCTLAAPALAQQSEAEMHRLEIRDGAVYHDGVMLPESELPAELDVRGLPPMYVDYSGDVTPAIEIDGRVFAFEDGQLIALETAAVRPRTQAFALTQPKLRGWDGIEEARHREAEEAYLQNLSESDRALYERLMREREMEGETLRLAQRYRFAEDEAERDTVRTELRRKLGAMFDLKQENRREEVRQMETVLDTLRQRLQERKAMRERIVEHRLNELIGQ